MVQSSQSVPGQIEAAIRKADPRSRAGNPVNLAPTQNVMAPQHVQPDEVAADIAMLLAPGQPRNADGTERQD